ncbi:MAG: methyl-accepting chemotaxis protein [Methanomicrobiales archaeon]|nr:methyl-accepting chemotaxis protein [Methanomicrobiales archaeon]
MEEDLDALKSDLKELRQFKAIMEGFVALNPSPILVWDSNRVVIDLNEAFTQATGYTRDEVIGKISSDFEYIEVKGEGIAECVKDKRAVRGEVAFRVPKGDVVFLCSTTPVLDDKNKVSRIFSLYTDITEQRRQMEEISSRYERTALVMQKLPTPILLWDMEKNILDTNESFIGKTGWTREKTLAAHLKDFEYLDKKGEGIDESIRDKRAVKGEATFRFPTGDFVWERYTIPLFNGKGEMVNLLSVYNDITDLRRSMVEVAAMQKQTEAIVQDNPMPILLWDRNLHVTTFNKAFLKLTGFSREEAGGLTIRDFHYTSQSGQSVKDTFSSGNASKGEATIEFPAGDRVLERYNIPLLDVSGSTANVLTVYNDITAQKSAIQDILTLAAETEKGNLSIRAKEGDYSGDFRLITSGINKVLDAVIGPMNVAAEYVDRIAHGEIPHKISDEYEGDFNEIKNNLNNLIDILSSRGRDVNFLIDSAIAGKLDVRADTTKYTGVHKAAIDGVNRLLDAVIAPLNVAAEYVDRIAHGEIPQKISDEYKGDFNEIKNNLNNLIDAINLLVEDANALTKAAVEGRLNARSDATRHLGDYKKIVEGVNGTLDAVITPIQEGLRVSGEYAQCRFAARFDRNIRLAGDFVAFRDSLNAIGEQLEASFSEITRVADAYAKGDFTAEVSRRLEVRGDLVGLKLALDTIGTNVSKTLSVVNQQIRALAIHAQHAHTGVEDVSHGADLIAKNAESTSNNAAKSEQGINQVLRTMEDLTVTVGEVSSKAESVAKLTVVANDLAKQGISAAEKADSGMTSITNTSTQAGGIIQDIRRQMGEISKIVGLITDIANQTNLLALNAAIEAARAGEAGRGFAVVASEVKSLAQESRSSAENIAGMIGGLHSRSEEAATAMSRAVTAVQDGNKAVGETLALFGQLSRSVDQITQNMDAVSQATEQQAASFEEITASVNEMSGLVKVTAKDAMNSSATSEEALAVVSQITQVIESINRVVENVDKEMARFSIRSDIH